jgi:hypothetical protein
MFRKLALNQRAKAFKNIGMGKEQKPGGNGDEE